MLQVADNIMRTNYIEQIIISVLIHYSIKSEFIAIKLWYEPSILLIYHQDAHVCVMCM